VSVIVQVETTAGVEAAEEIAAVPGVDGVFVGPSDLSASMGLLGQQSHPDVVEAVRRTFEAAAATGTPGGVHAFDPQVARSYADDGAGVILAGADVALLARGSEQLARDWVPASDDARGPPHCTGEARPERAACGAGGLPSGRAACRAGGRSAERVGVVLNRRASAWMRSPAGTAAAARFVPSQAVGADRPHTAGGTRTRGGIPENPAF